MTRAAGFFALPGELLVECFKYLDFKDLMRCKQVSTEEQRKTSIKLTPRTARLARSCVMSSRSPSSCNIASSSEQMASWKASAAP